MIFDITTIRNLHIKQINVVTVFLYKFLDELMYVKQSHEFVKNLSLICKLRKALYDLKQAFKVWSTIIRSFLNKLEFHKTKSNKSLFVLKNKKMFIAVYVDDLLVFKADMSHINKIKTELKNTFKITDLNSISHYLSMKIQRNRDKETLALLQIIYLETVLKKFDIKDCALIATSIKVSIFNLVLSSTKQANKATIYWYEISINSLMYIMITTRSDIFFALLITSRYCSNLSQTHVDLVSRIFKYIKNTLDLNIIFEESIELKVIEYLNVDYNETADERCSTKI